MVEGDHDIQRHFILLIKLIETQSGNSLVKINLPEIQIGEVYVHGPSKLDKTQFLSVYTFRASHVPSLNQRTQISAIIESFMQVNAEDIWLSSIYAENEGYIIFSNKEISVLYGIVQTDLKMEKYKLLLQEWGQGGLAEKAYQFINGIFRPRH